MPLDSSVADSVEVVDRCWKDLSSRRRGRSRHEEDELVPTAVGPTIGEKVRQ